ncbi:Fpg/Nei family DNA glycosylase [Nakamurella silvestris]|nr:Fpg/Nei family DNA glycosylase [Nakamurella silvestris]
MPELPEVTALAAFINEHGAGLQITSANPTSMNLLSTVSPAPSDLVGGTLRGADRHGKYLDLIVDTTSGRVVHLIVHLARAGWLRWSDKMPATIPKMGGPIAFRMRLSNGSGFDITEAGTKKSVTAWVVENPQEVPRIPLLGPDALAVSEADFHRVIGATTARLKTVLVDQHVIAGIGNAYSDEILHAAKLSPFATGKKLTPDALTRLYQAMRTILDAAVARSVGQEAARLKGEKRSGLNVHGRAGIPCPVCGDTVAQVELADRSFQYCPTCQTGGKKLADRAMSRLLK